MNEINDIHQNSLEWGCIANLVTKIGDIENKMKWPELIDMVADAFSEAEKEKDQSVLFFDWLQFFWRFYYRVKHMDKPAPFNQIYNDHREEEYFRVSNYDYRMFLYARHKGFTDQLNNNYFLIPKTKLTPGEIKQFDKKVKNTH